MRPVKTVSCTSLSSRSAGPAGEHDLLEFGEATSRPALAGSACSSARIGSGNLRVGLPIILSGLLAIESSLMFHLSSRSGHVVVRNDHADRAGPGGGLGEDRVLRVADGHRHVVAAAGRDAAHADHERNLLLGGQLLQMVVDVVAAGDGAAGRIDAQHDGLDVLVLADAVDLLLDEASSPRIVPSTEMMATLSVGVAAERVPMLRAARSRST